MTVDHGDTTTKRIKGTGVGCSTVVRNIGAPPLLEPTVRRLKNSSLKQLASLGNKEFGCFTAMGNTSPLLQFWIESSGMLLLT
jgi:hypothetical protein